MFRAPLAPHWGPHNCIKQMLNVKNDKSSPHSFRPDVTPTNKKFSHTPAGDAVSTTKHSMTITSRLSSKMKQCPIRARNKHDSGRHEAFVWLHNLPAPLVRVLPSRHGSNERFLYSHNSSVHHLSGQILPNVRHMILLWFGNDNSAVAWYGTRNVLSDFKDRRQIADVWK
jgi:hypothetical protein